LLLAAWAGTRPIGLRDARRPARTYSRRFPWHAPEARLRAAETAWLVAARRWARRAAGLGLASLVLRPARLSITPTHVDAAFDLSAVDLRIRRAGLDLNPGWIDWFGRVVSFAYEPIGRSRAELSDVRA
jgi:hypothetical protein